jgi:hypothetical protein
VATALVIHSTSAAFLLASPSSTTTYDLATNAIAVALLTAEGALKKLEHWRTVLTVVR